MNGLPLMLGSLALVLVGAGMWYFVHSDPMAMMLITSGVTGITGSAIKAQHQARKSEQLAQDAMDETQALRRNMHSRD